MQILWGLHDSSDPASTNPLRTDSEQQVALLVILPFRHIDRNSLLDSYWQDHLGKHGESKNEQPQREPAKL